MLFAPLQEGLKLILELPHVNTPDLFVCRLFSFLFGVAKESAQVDPACLVAPVLWNSLRLQDLQFPLDELMAAWLSSHALGRICPGRASVQEEVAVAPHGVVAYILVEQRIAELQLTRP